MYARVHTWSRHPDKHRNRMFLQIVISSRAASFRTLLAACNTFFGRDCSPSLVVVASKHFITDDIAVWCYKELEMALFLSLLAHFQSPMSARSFPKSLPDIFIHSYLCIISAPSGKPTLSVIVVGISRRIVSAAKKLPTVIVRRRSSVAAATSAAFGSSTRLFRGEFILASVVVLAEKCGLSSIDRQLSG